MRPLYDNFGDKNFHFSRRPLTFSTNPSQFFCTIVSPPKKTPRYLKPSFPQCKPAGSLGFPLFQLPINSASLLFQFILAEDKTLHFPSNSDKTCTSLFLLIILYHQHTLILKKYHCNLAKIYHEVSFLFAVIKAQWPRNRAYQKVNTPA